MNFDTQISYTVFTDMFFLFYKIFFILSNISVSLLSVVRLVCIENEDVSCAYRSSKKVFLWCVCLGSGFAAITAIIGLMQGNGAFPMSTFFISLGVNFHWLSKEVNVLSKIIEEYND